MKRAKNICHLLLLGVLVISIVFSIIGCSSNLEAERASYNSTERSTIEKTEKTNSTDNRNAITDVSALIINAESFFDGYAWITVVPKANNGTQQINAVIDPSGDISYFADNNFEPSRFERGASILTYGNGVKKVIDPKGNELFSTKSDICDDIIISGDGYYLVSKYYDNYERAGYDIFIINNKAERLIGFSELQTEIPEFYYCGEGIFAYATMHSFTQQSNYEFWNAETMTKFEIQDIPSSQDLTRIFDNGIALVMQGSGRQDDRPALLKTNGNLEIFSKNCRESTLYSTFSDGGFICAGYNYKPGFGDQVTELAFFDCVTKSYILIGDYGERVNLRKVESLHYIDGSLLLPLIGTDQKTYYAIMDKQGNSIVEPTQCNYVKSLNTCYYISTESGSTVVDLKGNELFKNTEGWQIEPFYDGLACIDDKNYIDIYGNVLFPDGIITINGLQSNTNEKDESIEENNSSYTPPETGSCGWKSTWTLDFQTGTLTISGEGGMDSYIEKDEIQPWIEYKDQIKKVVVEYGITYIGQYCFAECKNLKEINVSGSVESIGKRAFSECEKLEVVTLGNGVKTIGDLVFAGCVSLKSESLSLPYSIESIGDAAFYGCNSLTTFVLPDKVCRIERQAFAFCENLESFQCSKALYNIGIDAFSDCHNLKTLIVQDALLLIEASAFGGCRSLSEIYYTGNRSQWNEIYVRDGNSAIKYANVVYNYIIPED